MKRLFILAGALAALFGSLPASAALRVFACEPEWAALATEIGGDHVDVYSATTALQDPHKIQARPSLIARYRRADLVVCTGAQLEIGWLPVLERKGNNPKVRPGTPGYLEASRFVEMRNVPASVDRAQGDIHPDGNPHIQTDPHNIGKVAGPLADKLAELDPEHAADYRQRYAGFSARWNAAIQKWAAEATPLMGAGVISDHNGWPYLYAWLGMHEIATLEPKPGVPPSGAHLQSLLAVAKNQPVKMIVSAAYQDPRPSQWMHEHSGLPVATLPFSPGGVDGTEDLFRTFDVTIARLLAALKGQSS